MTRWRVRFDVDFVVLEACDNDIWYRIYSIDGTQTLPFHFLVEYIVIQLPYDAHVDWDMPALVALHNFISTGRKP